MAGTMTVAVGARTRRWTAAPTLVVATIATLAVLAAAIWVSGDADAQQSAPYTITIGELDFTAEAVAYALSAGEVTASDDTAFDVIEYDRARAEARPGRLFVALNDPDLGALYEATVTRNQLRSVRIVGEGVTIEAERAVLDGFEVDGDGDTQVTLAIRYRTLTITDGIGAGTCWNFQRNQSC